MKDMNSDKINRLKAYRGVASDYLDDAFKPVAIKEEFQRSILGCMGYQLDKESVEQSVDQLVLQQWQQIAPPVILTQQAKPLSIRINLPESIISRTMALSLTIGQHMDQAETGMDWAMSDLEVIESFQADQLYKAYQLDVEETLAQGQHQIRVQIDNHETIAECRCFVAPEKCYEPQNLASGDKIFGTAMQLYTLRSERNWGMGDFTDLKHFILDAAAQGIDIVGLNPLHALFPANPHHYSPYSPSNRAFINVMYIDPEAIPEFSQCAGARDMVSHKDFQRALEELRRTTMVNYVEVAEHKFRVFEVLFSWFAANELNNSASERAAAYRSFLKEQGPALELHALYEALHEHFLSEDMNLWGWPVWPDAYRDPASTAVEEFGQANRNRIEYYQFLQWCAFEQLRAAQQAALDAGMSVGIYLDLAVGVDMAGSEVWANKQLYCVDASVGAPPDALAQLGQDWGFPPFDPDALKRDAYHLFRKNLRASMSCAGAVRFDHCVSLMRLWWIPRGKKALEGAYVHYDLGDILSVLTAESWNNQCMVIGEDLGTFPEELTEVMRENHIYSYKVLYFETNKDDGRFTAPADYIGPAVATVTTHDLPTLASWWNQSDIDIRQKLGLFPTDEMAEQMRAQRRRDKGLLLEALYRQGCLSEIIRPEDSKTLSLDLNTAIHQFLAASNSAVMISQLDDWLSMVEPVNIPGTFKEHANWQRKLSAPIEGFFEREDVQFICRAIRQARPPSK